jgi:hypothetical protein
MRTKLVASLVSGCCSIAGRHANVRGAANAREIGSPEPRHVPAKFRVSMDILVDGQPVRVTCIKAAHLPVPRYALSTRSVTNHGPRRVVAVVSVDGLSVLNAQPAMESHPDMSWPLTAAW